MGDVERQARLGIDRMGKIRTGTAGVQGEVDMSSRSGYGPPGSGKAGQDRRRVLWLGMARRGRARSEIEDISAELTLCPIATLH